MSARAPAARVAAEAKLNLSLRITGRMANGYHALHTLFQRVALADIVTVRVDTPHRSLVCDAPAAGPVEHNLGWRAAAAFCQAAAWDTGFAITLEKHIPIGGGMGGGSADAAAVLRALNALAPAPLAPSALMAIGSQLGADVPFLLLTHATAVGTGTGAELTPIVAPPSLTVTRPVRPATWTTCPPCPAVPGTRVAVTSGRASKASVAVMGPGGSAAPPSSAVSAAVTRPT